MSNYLTKSLKFQKQYSTEDWKLTMCGEYIKIWKGIGMAYFSQATIPEHPWWV